MKQLFKLIATALSKWYYYQELKEMSLLAAAIATVWAAYNYGKNVLRFAFSPTGLTYLTFLMAAIVLGMVIKMYYRIIVIKYHEKDTHIQLFKNMNSGN